MIWKKKSSIFGQNRAIRGFNKAARAYNKEDFFHHDRIRPYPYRRNECRPYYDDEDDWKEEKTPAEKHQDRIDRFIDNMIDWGK